MRRPSAERIWAFGVGVSCIIIAIGIWLIVAKPTHSSGGSRNASASRVSGFGVVAFRVHDESATNSSPARCALLAKTEVQIETGLMNRHNLAGYDGMIFEYPPSRMAFWMKDTLIPLSIAWFDASGRFVNATDMVPCPPAQACPLHYPAKPASMAIEVPRGHLAALGVGPGATISVGGPCGS